ELPLPATKGDLTLLRKHVNVTSNGDYRLVLGWILMAMSGQGPYPILLMRAVQGSGKTTLGKLLKRVTDPVIKTALRRIWRNEHDLLIAAKYSAVLGFDNVSHLTPEQSDAVCRLATGAGAGGRTLYTDDEETVFDGMRPQLF